MPYPNNDQLLENLQRVLPEHAQDIFREVSPAGFVRLST